MATKREYSESTKAAVMAALLAGQSVNSVAREYRIPKGTVSAWRERATKGVAGVATQKGEEIRERLHNYLLASLDALRIQAMVFADEEWLKKQPADELAVLHGVLADKGIRLLEASAPPTWDIDDDTIIDI